MRKGGILTIGVGMLFTWASLLAINQGSSSAAGGVWTPSGANVVIDSTNLTFTIGAVTDECRAVSGNGTIGKESATWTFTPEFGGCTDPVTVKGAWTAKDVNSGEATLKTS